MKVQMGIFQEQEQIDTYLATKGIEHDDIMIAGPFSTRMQATEWMDFIEKRIDQGKMERHAVGLMNQQPWYGMTFESKTAKSERKSMPASTGLAAPAY